MVAPWTADVETALTPDQEAAIWALRHAASPILAGLSDQLRSAQLIEDGCVPVDRLGGISAAPSRGGLGAGGARWLFSATPATATSTSTSSRTSRKPDWKERVTALFETVSGRPRSSLGGTVAGEHGVADSGRVSRAPVRGGTVPRSAGEATRLIRMAS